jgi:GH15 family glucan-1,4-alpha-glucosidase
LAVLVRIEDYGLIGDLQTAALVGRDGAVDWPCLPRFDSASCFAALLGDERHGRWRVAPKTEVRASSREYRPGTLVLETDFETAEGSVRVIDFMPRRGDGPPRLMRIVEGLKGRVSMHVDLSLRPDYASIVPWLEPAPDGVIATAGPDAFRLSTVLPLEIENGTVRADFDAVEGARNGSRSRGTCRTRKRHRSRTPTRHSPARRSGGGSGAGAAPTRVAIGTRW